MSRPIGGDVDHDLRRPTQYSALHDGVFCTIIIPIRFENKIGRGSDDAIINKNVL